MLMPKRTKYRRPHRVSYDGRSKAGREITFGEYGLVAEEGAYVNSNQLEAARVAMTRYMKRGGQTWCKVFPHMAKTKKPLEVRMGSGKGAPDSWVAVVAPGRILFEVAQVDEAVAHEALRLAANKLPIKTRFVRKGEEAKAK
jgi:large subunit ribosomal protein L16